jgi:hypothetical protein
MSVLNAREMLETEGREVSGTSGRVFWCCGEDWYRVSVGLETSLVGNKN